ncbi:MAG TPA: D-cysteine desulfhydrase family protein [Candidatus Dormibacteraeota bacterium]|nr:D-cysteine desulfhydrase family protein [Candidatus Dormibacteraeota bacterium]
MTPRAAGPLETALAAFPRVELTRAETPLQRLNHVSERLDLDVWMKRDDLTDLALGGDKARKLEYELARAVGQGADTLVTCGSSQSNFARLVTAAARRLGLECALVLSAGHHPEPQGNLLIVRLMGADVRIVDTTDIWDLEGDCLALCDELRAAGRHPYYVPVSGTTATSCLGYVRAGFELNDQLRAAALRPAAVYVPFGTGGIFTGLRLAFAESQPAPALIGVSVNRDRSSCEELARKREAEVCSLLGVSLAPAPVALELRDDQLGGGYGEPTPACLDAIVELASREGILLDPVYSGKVVAALLADGRAARWVPGTTVVMLHSGGVPALFAYQDELLTHLSSTSVATG